MHIKYYIHYIQGCCLQVTLVAMAPLTNLAVAVQLDPSISKKLKALYIMGGNTECTLSVFYSSPVFFHLCTLYYL